MWLYKDKKQNTMTPFIIVNFSHHEHLHLQKDQVIAFAEKEVYHGGTRTRTSMKLDTRMPKTGEND